MQLLYVAKYYLVRSLERRCIDYLRSELNVENALVLLNHRTLIDDEDLMNKCRECIDREFEEFAKTEDFKDINYDYLDKILSRDSIEAKEVSIFNGVLEWAKQACTRKNLPITGENQRTVLGDAFYKIRFPTMTEEEFTDTAAQSDILSVEEKLSLFLHFSGKKQNLPFVSRRRQTSFCKIHNCIDSNDYDEDQLYGGIFISLQTEKSVLQKICIIWVTCDGACEYDVQYSPQ